MFIELHQETQNIVHNIEVRDHILTYSYYFPDYWSQRICSLPLVEIRERRGTMAD